MNLTFRVLLVFVSLGVSKAVATEPLEPVGRLKAFKITSLSLKDETVDSAIRKIIDYSTEPERARLWLQGEPAFYGIAWESEGDMILGGVSHKISAQLDGVTLYDAFAEVAEQANLHVYPLHWGIVLTSGRQPSSRLLKVTPKDNAALNVLLTCGIPSGFVYFDRMPATSSGFPKYLDAVFAEAVALTRSSIKITTAYAENVAHESTPKKRFSAYGAWSYREFLMAYCSISGLCAIISPDSIRLELDKVGR